MKKWQFDFLILALATGVSLLFWKMAGFEMSVILLLGIIWGNAIKDD